MESVTNISNREEDGVKDNNSSHIKTYFKIVDINSILQNPILPAVTNNDVHSYNLQQKSDATKNVIVKKIGNVPVNLVTHNDAPQETPTVSKPKKPNTRCFEFTKKLYKLDLEGFTFFDRLGFHGAEAKRAKKCLRSLDECIKERELMLARLQPHLSLSKTIQKERKIKGSKKRKTATKYIKGNKNIVCSRTVKVSDNLRLLCNSDIKVELPAYCKTNSFEEFVDAVGCSSSNTFFVDSTNLESVHAIKEQNPSSNIYFINEDRTLTSLLFDMNPSIRDKVTVIDLNVYNKYIKLHSKPIKTSKKPTTIMNNRSLRTKQKRFLDVVTQCHNYEEYVNDVGLSLDTPNT